MSYRLISSNDIAIKYPEVNDMPCIYADLPNGMDGEHYVLEQGPKTGHWIPIKRKPLETPRFKCSECNTQAYVETCMGKPIWDYCPSCGAKMVERLESEEEK